jgi:hypothetical protein
MHRDIQGHDKLKDKKMSKRQRQTGEANPALSCTLCTASAFPTAPRHQSLVRVRAGDTNKLRYN